MNTSRIQLQGVTVGGKPVYLIMEDKSQDFQSAMDKALEAAGAYEGYCDYKDVAEIRESVLLSLGIDLGTDAVSCPRRAAQMQAEFLQPVKVVW